MNTLVLPSLIGVGSTDTGLLSLGAFSRGRSRALPHQVAWDGVTYLVGAGVEAYSRPIERMDFHRLGDGPELRALTYATLGLLLGPTAPPLALQVGLPVEVLANTDLARATLRQLRAWLSGTQAVTINGILHTLTIQELNVLAQPAGGFFAWGCNDAGQWVRPAADLKTLIGICDVGFNTLDLLALQGGQVLQRYTSGDTLGVRRAAEWLTQAVARQYQVKLALHQADALLHERQPTLTTAGQTVNLTPLVHQALETAAGALTAFLETHWGNGRQFGQLLFTGGGAELLRDTLLRQYPYGVVLPDPVIANALGLARYARRLYPEAPVVIGLDPGFGGFKAVGL